MIPIKPGTAFYPLYEKLGNSSVFGEIFENNPKFYDLKHSIMLHYTGFMIIILLSRLLFHKLNLGIIIPQEITFLIQKNSSGFQFNGFSEASGRFTVMLTFNASLSLPNVFQFSVESEKQAAFTFRAFSDINNRTTNYSYTEKLLDGKENVIVDLNQCSTSGNFNANHVEGILIGIRTDANADCQFNFQGLSSIQYPLS